MVRLFDLVAFLVKWFLLQIVIISAEVGEVDFLPSRQHTAVGKLRTLLLAHKSPSASPQTRISRKSESTGLGSIAMSRRAAIGVAIGAVGMSPTSALADFDATSGASNDERQALLAAIAAGDDQGVETALGKLIPFDPSGGQAATSAALGGEWQLIWSANTAAFSPLLSLPGPLRPESTQLLGTAAAKEVGDGRVAQLLRKGPFEQILSSQTAPDPSDASILEIFPPFRLELKVRGVGRWKLVEAGSDAEFRALNARSADAQAAQRNKYSQSYLETSGAPGDLRISKVISGDPVIVGSIFVHQRVKS